MTAFSIGREAARTDNREIVGTGTGTGAGAGPGPVAKALGIITELIPAEAIAAYLAVVAAVAAFAVEPGQQDYRQVMNVALAIPVAILVCIAVSYIGAADEIRRAPQEERAQKVWRVLGFSLALSALFIVYVLAMPGNPFELLWGVPSALGGLLAVLITIIWGIVKAVVGAFNPSAKHAKPTARPRLP